MRHAIWDASLPKHLIHPLTHQARYSAGRTLKLTMDATITEVPNIQASRLLTIPGGRQSIELLNSSADMLKEIRNRIYDIAVNDVLNKATMPGLAHPQRKAHSLRETQSLTRNWRLFRRSCLGLTQTCRQLRDELLPIHQARIPVTIRLTELEDYTATFIGPLRIGSIVVEAPEEIQNVNIRDVILLCHGSPSMLTEVHWKMPMRLQKLQCSLQRYPSLQSYIAGQVDRVTAVPGIRWNVQAGLHVPMVRMHLHVKNNCGKAWMKAPFKIENQEELKEWWISLGLPVGINVLPVWN